MMSTLILRYVACFFLILLEGTLATPVPQSSTSDALSTFVGACLSFRYSLNFNINDAVLFPHLIIPVSRARATANDPAYTVYAPTLNSSVVTLFAFDIPWFWDGYTCDVVFGLPEYEQLPNSTTYVESGGDLDVNVLGLADGNSLVDGVTFMQVAPFLATATDFGSITEHGTTNITAGLCAAGQRVVYALAVQESSTYSLEYFQDADTCALGMFIVTL